jgi:hypothetical protein
MKSPMEILASGSSIQIHVEEDLITIEPKEVWIRSHCCSTQVSHNNVKDLHAALGAWLRKNRKDT